MATETSACGGGDRRCDWLDFAVRDVARLRAKEVPMTGYTWRPMVDRLDWDGAMPHQTGKSMKRKFIAWKNNPTET